MRFLQPILYKNDGTVICENANTINFQQSANVPRFNEQPRKKVNIIGNNTPIKISFWSFLLGIWDNLTPTYIVPFQTGQAPFYSTSGKRRYYFRYGGTLKNLFVSAKENSTFPSSTTIGITVMIGSGVNNSVATNLSTSMVTAFTNYNQASDLANAVVIAPYDWIEIRYNTSNSFFHDIATTGSLDFYPNFGA